MLDAMGTIPAHVDVDLRGGGKEKKINRQKFLNLGHPWYPGDYRYDLNAAIIALTFNWEEL